MSVRGCFLRLLLRLLHSAVCVVRFVCVRLDPAQPMPVASSQLYSQEGSCLEVIVSVICVNAENSGLKWTKSRLSV